MPLGQGHRSWWQLATLEFRRLPLKPFTNIRQGGVIQDYYTKVKKLSTSLKSLFLVGKSEFQKVFKFCTNQILRDDQIDQNNIVFIFRIVLKLKE